MSDDLLITPPAPSRNWLEELTRNSLSIPALRQLWREYQIEPKEKGPGELAGFAKAALKAGDFLLCLEVVDFSPGVLAECAALRFLKARALTQTGSTNSARELLEEIVRDGDADCDTYSLIGRSYKDDWSVNQSPETLREAILAYRKAAELYPASYYPLVNVASLELFAGNSAEAEHIAEKALALCAKVRATDPEDPWLHATIGEALVCLGRIEEARSAFRDYASMSSTVFAPGLRDLCSTRRQVRLILAQRNLGRNTLDDCFPIPSVVVFAGHMIDAPDRAQNRQRFPTDLAPIVGEAIGKILSEKRVQIGFSSAAAGGDILFAEQLFERKGEIHLVLTGPVKGFRERSVEYLKDSVWVQRFDEVINRAASVALASNHHPSEDSETYQFGMLVMCGLAGKFAAQIGLDLFALALWDGKPGDGGGGTADFVQFWNNFNRSARSGEKVPVILISPESLRPNLTLGSSEPDDESLSKMSRSGSGTSSPRQVIHAILFADVVGFSKLAELALPRFVRSYMRAVSALMDEGGIDRENRPIQAPILVNTWGDAFYMVFESVAGAGQFALRMQEALVPPPVGRADWTKEGLPADLSIRIALHAGPVYSAVDPVTREFSYFGSHVVLAARLEPVTAHGEVFCTEGFAAMAFVEKIREFSCEYLGRRELAKSFGEMAVFRVCRTKR